MSQFEFDSEVYYLSAMNSSLNLPFPSAKLNAATNSSTTAAATAPFLYSGKVEVDVSSSLEEEAKEEFHLCIQTAYMIKVLNLLTCEYLLSIDLRASLVAPSLTDGHMDRLPLTPVTRGSRLGSKSLLSKHLHSISQKDMNSDHSLASFHRNSLTNMNGGEYISGEIACSALWRVPESRHRTTKGQSLKDYANGDRIIGLMSIIIISYHILYVTFLSY
jgi:hypothetical protein